jgi:hypothetical protein
MAKQSKIRDKKRWKQVLRDWKRSGLSGSAFCRKNHLGIQSFYAWKNRLVGKSAKTFLPVQVIASPGENQVVLELTLKNGRVLRLYREMPSQVLAELVRGLEAEAC